MHVFGASTAIFEIDYELHEILDDDLNSVNQVQFLFF